MLWLRHSLQLTSSHKLSLFLSHSLALCKSITNVAIKAMKCLDVPHTNGKFCVKLLWMRQMVTDNEWFKKNKKKNIVQVWYSVLRCIFSRSTRWSMILLLIHFIIWSIVFLLLHGTSGPSPLYSLSLPYQVMILNTHQSNHTPLWSALYFTLVVVKKKTRH